MTPSAKHGGAFVNSLGLPVNSTCTCMIYGTRPAPVSQRLAAIRQGFYAAGPSSVQRPSRHTDAASVRELVYPMPSDAATRRSGRVMLTEFIVGASASSQQRRSRAKPSLKTQLSSSLRVCWTINRRNKLRPVSPPPSAGIPSRQRMATEATAPPLKTSFTWISGAKQHNNFAIVLARRFRRFYPKRSPR